MSTTNNQELHVVFGTGALGTALIEALAAQGHAVRAINRSGRAGLPAGVELLAGDASDAAFTRKAAAGATTVYFMVNPPYTRWRELFPPMQAAVLAGAEAAGAKYVAMENLYAYGDTGGQPMTEDMPFNAHTRKGKVRAQMTRDLIDAHEQGRVRVAMARASDYFGPRAVAQSALGERVIYPALAGKTAQVIGSSDQPHTFSYAPDIGKALAILGTEDAAMGEAWHLPNPETTTIREIIHMIYEEAGHPPKIQQMPDLMVNVVALFMPILREVKEMLYEFEQPFIVDTSKWARAFPGKMQPTPLRQAVTETVAWFRANPQAG